jgi:hypothetical protein
MAAILQSISPARQYDPHPEQWQPKYPNPATTALRIEISGKAQQAYVAIEEEIVTNDPVNGIKEQGARA